MIENLENQRKTASEASQGMSSQPIYSLFLQQIIELSLKGDLLDFGAGTGNLTKQLKSLNQFNSITAVDLFPCPVNLDSDIEWAIADLNEITNFPVASFDVIVSAEVIEHLENPRGVAREWYRLLRPGGKLVFSTPNNESWRSLLSLLMRGHFRLFWV